MRDKNYIAVNKHAMRLKPFLSIPIILLAACGEVTVKEVKIDPVEKLQEIPPPPPPPPPPPARQIVISGSWTDGTSPNANFSFTPKGIYYTEHNKAFEYELIRDTILIHFDDFTYKAKLSLRSDTLVFEDEDGEKRFWQFNKK